MSEKTKIEQLKVFANSLSESEGEIVSLEPREMAALKGGAKSCYDKAWAAGMYALNYGDGNGEQEFHDTLLACKREANQ